MDSATMSIPGAPEVRAGSLFLPSRVSAEAIDVVVRKRLAGSLDWVAEAFPELKLPQTVISGWKARPSDFGFYYELASAIQHGIPTADAARLETIARALRGSIHAGSQSGEGPQITTLAADFYTPLEIDCLLRWFDMEPSNSMELLALDPDEFEVACRNLHKALRLLKEAAPDFYGELDAITTEIVFAKPQRTAKMRFGGASSFALWGALALNVEAHPDWWQYLPRLIHEYSHNLLFGIAMDGPIVLNDPSETYSSPLREDARPIDGIFHAAFVSAREAMAMHQVANGATPDDDELTPEQLREYAQSTADRSREAFNDCAAVLRKHARLSDIGECVLGECEEWMARNAV